MALARHKLDALIKTCITERNGGISAEEKLVDGLALLQSCQCTVLPENGSGIGQGALKTLVTAKERAVAKLQSFVKDLPELFNVTAGGKCYVGQVDGNNALVESAVVLRLALCINVRR